MIDANGAGLAAPQVHVPLRLVIFQAPGERSRPRTWPRTSNSTTPPP